MGKESPAPEVFDDLQTVVLFVRAIERRSLTGAAKALRMTTSAVSKRIARLEERLDVRLINRTTRSFAPTEAGQLFYEHCAQILHAMNEAEKAVAQYSETPRGLLRVSAQITIGDKYLAPLSAAFLARYPKIRLDVVTTDRFANLIEEGLDVAIRLALELSDSTLIARRIMSMPLLVVGAPSYFARRGTPQVPDDLLAHDCIHFSEMQISREWAMWTSDGPIIVPVTPKSQFDTAEAMRQAAIAGLGLVKLPYITVASDIKEGKLMPVLESYNVRPIGLYAVYTAGKHTSPKVRAFVDFLALEFPTLVPPII